MRRIVRGEVAVGDVLPREADLAQEFGVNRSVVREAVKLLEVHGLARPVRRRGTVVLDPMTSVSPGVLQVMLSPGGSVVDRAVLADLLEVRTQIDVQMTGLAAERRTDADLNALTEAAVTVRAALGNATAFGPAVDAFALAVAQASHNRLFHMLAHWQGHVLANLGDLMGAVQQPTEPHVQGVELLLELIRRQDALNARRIVAAFHRWTTPRLLAAAALRSGAPLSELLEGSS